MKNPSRFPYGTLKTHETQLHVLRNHVEEH